MDDFQNIDNQGGKKFMIASFLLPLLGVLVIVIYIAGINMYALSVGVEAGLLDHYLSDKYGRDAYELYHSLDNVAYFTALTLYILGIISGFIALSRTAGKYKKRLIGWLILLFILSPIVLIAGCDIWRCHI